MAKENIETVDATVEDLDAKIEARAIELVEEARKGNSKLKKLFPIVVMGDEEYDDVDFYVAVFKQPSFPAFSKYLALSQKDQAGSMRELAKDCFVAGNKEVINEDELFIFGVMPQLGQIIEARQSRIVDLSKLGK